MESPRPRPSLAATFPHELLTLIFRWAKQAHPYPVFAVLPTLLQVNKHWNQVVKTASIRLWRRIEWSLRHRIQHAHSLALDDEGSICPCERFSEDKLKLLVSQYGSHVEVLYIDLIYDEYQTETTWPGPSWRFQPDMWGGILRCLPRLTSLHLIMRSREYPHAGATDNYPDRLAHGLSDQLVKVIGETCPQLERLCLFNPWAQEKADSRIPVRWCKVGPTESGVETLLSLTPNLRVLRFGDECRMHAFSHHIFNILGTHAPQIHEFDLYEYLDDCDTTCEVGRCITLLNGVASWTRFCESCTELGMWDWGLLESVTDEVLEVWTRYPKMKLRTFSVMRRDPCPLSSLRGDPLPRWSCSLLKLQAAILSCPNLEQLTVMDVTAFGDFTGAWTDTFLHTLSKTCANLSTLHLTRGEEASRITDAGLAHLANLHYLSDITLTDHPGITHDGVAALAVMENRR
ncbi:hypothetical protein HK104_006091, partial [Borealophlyctis nickersoniae]